ncbi:MAG: hypothetical protein AB1646_01815 [Thermodesulfobacteriota bacterium]
MVGKYPGYIVPALFFVVLTLLGLTALSAHAYRLCTFKGTVVGHGWRTMVVRSNGQCATVNVGWRTRYIPNRRPCLGERVAVDFALEDGYMKATKVVSLTPTPTPSRCYPPAPPRTTACRQVADERVVGECPRPEGICARTPPPHVTGRVTPTKPPARRPEARRPPTPAPEPPKPKNDKPVTTEPQEPTTPTTPEPETKTLTGEVVASSPTRLSIRVTKEDDTREVVPVKVGLRTKFVPFRRPATGEKVEVQYVEENGGEKFGKVVQVIE